jgi:hypothetical protein
MMDGEELLNTSSCIIRLCLQLNRISHNNFPKFLSFVQLVQFLSYMLSLGFQITAICSEVCCLCFHRTILLLFGGGNYRQTHSCGDINKLIGIRVCISYKAFDYITFGHIRAFLFKATDGRQNFPVKVGSH